MSAPFDKAFKLFAEDDELGLLRVVAKLPLPDDAKIEHLDRELDLPTLRVDHLYRITVGSKTRAVHMEAFSNYDSDWRRRLCRYSALIWAKYEQKLMSYMILLTDRGVPGSLAGRFRIDAGDLKLRLRTRIIRMWEVPARDLLATGNPAMFAWVPLADATAEELRKAAEAVVASGDAELQARMAVLYGLRYLGSEVLESMLTEEIIKESSFYKKILNRGIEQGREQGLEQGIEKGIEKGRREGFLDGERQILCGILVQKFGPLPERVDERLRTASEADLERWIKQLLSASSIDEALA